MCWPRFDSDLHTHRWPTSLLFIGPLSEQSRARGATHLRPSRCLSQCDLALPLSQPPGTTGAGAWTHCIHLLSAGGSAALWVSAGWTGATPPSYAMWPLQTPIREGSWWQLPATASKPDIVGPFICFWIKVTIRCGERWLLGAAVAPNNGH